MLLLRYRFGCLTHPKTIPDAIRLLLAQDKWRNMQPKVAKAAPLAKRGRPASKAAASSRPSGPGKVHAHTSVPHTRCIRVNAAVRAPRLYILKHGAS